MQVYYDFLLLQLVIHPALTNERLLEARCDISKQKYLIFVLDTPKLSSAIFTWNHEFI